MQKQLATWQLINNSLQQKVAVMLLYVLESKGSSPGRQGFFMAVTINGEMEGSIGGGIMEHKFVEMAKQHLKVNVREHTIRKQVHDKAVAKDQSGMICSGEQTIFMYHVEKKDMVHVEMIIASLHHNKNGLLNLSKRGVHFTPDAIPYFNYHFHFNSEEDWQYEEKTGYKNHLYIIGGGHCALAFSKLMKDMDFYIHLFDNRGDLNTIDQNNYVQEKKIVNDYTELSNLIPSGSENYVAIMTFGYRTDEQAFRALVNKKFKYLGLLGSRKKVEKLFTDFRNDGIAEKVLRSVYSPIGLQIKSQTPEEIAISIAAEIIKVKNETA